MIWVSHFREKQLDYPSRSGFKPHHLYEYADICILKITQVAVRPYRLARRVLTICNADVVQR